MKKLEKKYYKTNYVDINGEIVEKQKLKNLIYKRADKVQEIDNENGRIKTTVIIDIRAEQLTINFDI